MVAPQHPIAAHLREGRGATEDVAQDSEGFRSPCEEQSGPQPHPNFIEVFGGAATRDCHQEAERAADMGRK